MDFLETIQKAGIVGAGGAGFPTHVKLKAKAKWLIVNAAECEPLIETDKFLCRTCSRELIGAIMAVSAHLEAEKAVIAIKGKYKAEIAALESAIQELDAKVEIFQMATFYPAGDEQTIVTLVTGKPVPERGLPLDVGAVVQNVGTLYNVFQAITTQKGVTRKFLSLTGEVLEPIMLDVPIGTSVRDCLARVKGLPAEYGVIMGGPMMGKILTAQSDIEKAVVTKVTGNILVLPKGHYLLSRSLRPMEKLKAQARAACIQCRMCTDLCPRYLIGHQIRPHLVMRNLWRMETMTDKEEFLKSFGDAVNCCSCGACEMFSCPMGLSPRKVNDYMKGQLRERGIEVPKNQNPQIRPNMALHQIPTGRLIARLGLGKYDGAHAHDCQKFDPETVFIPFAQHIGKPATCVKAVGDRVEAGALLAEANGFVSANIHASVTGTILEINDTGAKIACDKEV